MSDRPQIHICDLLKALNSLALASHMYAGGRAHTPKKAMLDQALSEAYAALRSDVRLKLDISDPDQLVQSYIAAGGNWQALVASVNRHAYEGTMHTRPQEKGGHHGTH